jgi:hypothetical protein
MAYMGAATSIVHQGRMRVPTAEWDRADSTSSLSLWPPGFPAAIALPVYFGASPVQSARWINVIAAGITAAMVVLLISGPLGIAAGIAGAIVVFATQAVFDTYLSVLSEPLFIALIVLLLFAMVHARNHLILLSVLATAAVMVRYAGAFAPAAAVIWTLVDSQRDFRARVRRAITVALLPFIAIALWIARTAIAPDRHATPELNLYGGWSDTIVQARDTLAEWLAPLLSDGTLQRAIALVLTVALASFVIMAASDTSGNRLKRLRVGGLSALLGAASLLGACYVAIIVASRAFVGGTIPFDWRILAPLIVLIEIEAVAAIAYWWRAYHFPMRVAIAIVALVWLGATTTATVNDAVYATTEGSDFANTSWRDSPLTAWVRANAVGRPLYSNWPPALYFHANRIARELPDSTDPEDMTGFAERIRANHGYVVAFNERSPDFIAPETLARDIGLHQVVRTTDGAVWAADTTAGVVTPRPDSASAPGSVPSSAPAPVRAPASTGRPGAPQLQY